MLIIGVPLGLLFLFLIWWVTTNNRFVALDRLIDESWSNVDIALKRRSSVIPNLVEVAKGYAAHERELFERIAMARERTLRASSTAERAASENELAQSTFALFARAEAYPELKANEQFLELQREIVSTEDRIAAARRLFNANVRELNVLRESFPSSMVASYRSVPEAALFELDDPAARNDIHVKF